MKQVEHSTSTRPLVENQYIKRHNNSIQLFQCYQL